MQRRQLLALSAAATLLPFAARAQFVPYTPGIAEQAMANGERIILNFNATWCSTCARQVRIMDSLRAANPAYAQNLTLIRIDWDQYANGDLSRQFAVPRRSTNIALKGQTELGRTVAGTSEDVIRGLFDAALNA